jgi:death-on-curing protein
MIRLLTLDAVLAIHRRQIAEHGGEAGVRDISLLESALARPQNVISYVDKVDVATLAAAYAFGIAKNHPFIDGNKRTALIAMRTFLILNGVDITASQQDKYQAIMALAAGDLSEDDLAVWIRTKLEGQYREP